MKRHRVEIGRLTVPRGLLNAYFVRTAADHEVVGLFVASSVVLLAAPVDECCDPALCEYTLASMGGLMVSAATTSRWPLSDDAPAEATGLEDAVPTQQWEDDLREADDRLDWRPLKPAATRLLRVLEGKQRARRGPAGEEAAATGNPAG